MVTSKQNRQKSPAKSKSIKRELKAVTKTLRAIKALKITDGLKQHVIKHTVWWVAHVSPPRYASRKALKQKQEDAVRDHVWEMSKLWRSFLQGKTTAKSLTAKGYVCRVTRAEHAKLDRVGRTNPRLNGWQRYKAAKIVVMDLETGKKVDWRARD